FPKIVPRASYNMRTTFPPRVFQQSDYNKTLQELQLVPSGTIILQVSLDTEKQFLNFLAGNRCCPTRSSTRSTFTVGYNMEFFQWERILMNGKKNLIHIPNELLHQFTFFSGIQQLQSISSIMSPQELL